jgi:hypothetical protein
MIDFYNEEANSILRNAKDLVPRIVTYDRNFAFCLIERHNPTKYYCLTTKYGIADRNRCCRGDAIKKLSLEYYFKTSYRLKRLGYKLNLKKIIYDSNRNK